jgi:hypothetical protein
MQQESTERLPTRQLIPAEPIAPRPPISRPRRPRRIGSVRIPIAGPYQPRATLYRFPDGRLLWTVRLWEVDRAVCRVVATPALLRFARLNHLPKLEAELATLQSQAMADAAPR